MRWPIARNRVSAPTSSIAPVQAAGAEVRLWAASGERRRRSLLLPVIAVIFYLAVSMSSKACRWVLVGSASIGTVAVVPAKRTWLDRKSVV